MLIMISGDDVTPMDNTFKHEEVCKAYANYFNVREKYRPRSDSTFICKEIKLPTTTKE